VIAIVDTGGANIGSVVDGFARVGVEAKLSAESEVILAADGVVLPGVGAAADSMARIREKGLEGTLRALERPVLGICLGMQLLFERSEEGGVDCLGLLPGSVRRLPASPEARIPHMGWNRVTELGGPLFARIEEGAWFYFVHSYAAPDGDFTAARSEHGAPFPAAVAKGLVFGVQFHPERSGANGAALLKNFAEVIRCN
jgi:glutamine amidotransferase